MSFINTSDWKEFIIDKLFKIKRGKRLIEEDRETGNVFYFSASQDNNGLTDKIANPLFIEKDSLIYTTFGDCYYVEGEFTASDEISILKNNNLNKNIGLFIATIINKNKYKYAYGRKAFQNKFVNESIKLPVKKDENNCYLIDQHKKYSDEGYIPDWEYMEQFIERLEEREGKDSIKNSLITRNEATKVPDLNINDWKEFLLEDIFDEIYKSEAYVKSDLTTFDSNRIDRIPFISRTDKNNGYDCYVSLVDISVKENGSAIIIGDTTSTIYYQEKDFITGDHIVVCRAKWINKYTALFIKSLIEKERYKYSYGRAFKMDLIKKTKINLPAININGEFVPDWDFMESYIKSLPYADRI